MTTALERVKLDIARQTSPEAGGNHALVVTKTADLALLVALADAVINDGSVGAVNEAAANLTMEVAP